MRTLPSVLGRLGPALRSVYRIHPIDSMSSRFFDTPSTPFGTAGRVASLFSILLVTGVLVAGCGPGEAQPAQPAASQSPPDTSKSEHSGEKGHHEGEHDGEHDGEKGGKHEGGHEDKHEGGHGEKHGDKHEGGARGVAIGAERARQLGIEVDELPGGSATSTISRPATATFDPNRVAQVGPRIEGKIVRVTKDLGDRVRAGEAVAVLSRPFWRRRPSSSRRRRSFRLLRRNCGSTASRRRTWPRPGSGRCPFRTFV